MKELIREKEFANLVNKSIREAFEDKWTMDYECEGVEPTLFVESGGFETPFRTTANIWQSMMWSSGARPENLQARAYVDTAIESAEQNAEEEYPDDDEAFTEYIMQDLDGDYAPYVEVEAYPRFFANRQGFCVCDLTIRMFFMNYLGAEIVKYEPKKISFSTVTMQENLNKNYLSEDDFEFESGGFPVDAEIIREFIRAEISDYVKHF